MTGNGNSEGINMKLDSMLNTKPRDWYVTVKGTGRKVFLGSKTECLRFIAGFDRASSKYVDLRVHDKDGREFNYHKGTYTV